jgi:hypothetical protein
MTRTFGRTAIAALAICSLAACSKDNNDASTTTNDSTSVASTPTPPPPPQMTDANMLAALAAGDSTDMALGNTLKTTATFPALKSLGNMLVADHTAHLKDVEALAKKDSMTITPMAGDTSAQHRDNLKASWASLTKGTSADSALVETAINAHKAGIDRVDDFDGKTQNADIKALLASTKIAMQKHLDAAQKVKDSMDKANKK